MAASTASMGSDVPAFSYAQAAKGLAPVQQAKTTTPADQKKPATASNLEGLRAPETSTNTEVAVTNGTAEAPHSQDTEVDIKKASATSSPSYTTASTATLPKADDISSTPNGSSESTWDKQSQVSSSVDRSSQATDASKDKMSENGWEKTPTPPKELKAAPIPAVNIWQQRREAQEAKAKAMAASKIASGTTSKAPATKSSGTGSSRDKKKPSDSKGKDEGKSSTPFPPSIVQF